MSDEVVDVDLAGLGKRSMPSRVAWKRKSPKARSSPLSRVLKIGLEHDEYGMNSTDPKRIDLVRVVDSSTVELTGVDDP
jgi:hypothetical protein